MESQLINCVSEDRLLDEDNIASGNSILFNELKNVFSFFLKESVHSGVVVNNHIVF